MTQHRLRGDLVIVAQTYRGEQTYIVKDPQSHKYFRFRPVEILVMQEFDGTQTVPEVASALAGEGVSLAPAAIEGFAHRLKDLGLFERSLAERSVLLMERLRAQRHRRLRSPWFAGSLLRMRWSVGDPDRLLDRWLPRLRFCFTPAFLAISVALFVAYFVVVFARWPEIRGALAALYTPSGYTFEFVLLFWGTALVVFAIHELGHGFTCKHFGGQVHEMGAMLIYFQPAFYCNVNDAWTFPDLRARLWVTAAGSWIQLVVAGLAAIVWWAAAPETLVSQIALAAVLVGGVTTVLANANPLIPLDGYYALSDYLAIPNLRRRAFAYLAWLVKRHVLRLAAPRPPADEREQRVFMIYGPLALLYSASILLLLAGALFGWVSGALGALGIAAFALAAWAVLRGRLRRGAHAVVTAVREHRAVWRSPALRRRAGAAAVGVFLLGLLLPWPITVTGRFRAAAPLEVTASAPDSAVVAQVYVREGTRVAAGARLVRLRSFELERRALALQRLADSLAAREAQARAFGSAAETRTLEAERAERAAELTAVRARLEALLLRAPIAGVVVTPRLEESLGRAVPAGEGVVRLDARDSIELRVTLDRAGASLVRPGHAAAVVPYADVGASVRAPVASVAVAAAGSSRAPTLEARIRVRGDSATRAAFRPGATGRAKVFVRRSNVWGALWWQLRQRVRSDVLL